MDKRKVFCTYARMYDANDMYDSLGDDKYYIIAIANLTKNLLKVGQFNEEQLEEELNGILFWALYNYGDYTMREVETFLDVEVDQLPINMERKKFLRFKKVIGFVVTHYEFISEVIGKPCPISKKHFKPFLTRTEKFSIEIPAVWLNT
jgi:hypothetical protein